MALVGAAWRVSQRMGAEHRWLGAAAFGLSVCYVVFAITDNVLDYYNTFAQYAFFALGAALAMDAVSKRADRTDRVAGNVAGEPNALADGVSR